MLPMCGQNLVQLEQILEVRELAYDVTAISPEKLHKSSQQY